MNILENTDARQFECCGEKASFKYHSDLKLYCGKFENKDITFEGKCVTEMVINAEKLLKAWN